METSVTSTTLCFAIIGGQLRQADRQQLLDSQGKHTPAAGACRSLLFQHAVVLTGCYLPQVVCVSRFIHSVVVVVVWFQIGVSF